MGRNWISIMLMVRLWLKVRVRDGVKVSMRIHIICILHVRHWSTSTLYARPAGVDGTFQHGPRVKCGMCGYADHQIGKMWVLMGKRSALYRRSRYTLYKHICSIVQCLSTTIGKGSCTGISTVTVQVSMWEMQWLKCRFLYSSFWHLEYGFAYEYIGSCSMGYCTVDASN